MVTFRVTNTNDAGEGSLRNAINQANANPGQDMVLFNPDLMGTIGLTSGTLAVTDPVGIFGPQRTQDQLLTIAADQTFRVFNINDGTNALIDVTIDCLRITNGGGVSNGAGIFNREDLLLKGSIISGNTATNVGGAIYNNFDSTATVSNSTISGNTARFGGGISSVGFGTTATVSNSTISGNMATSYGGGIANFAGSRTIVNNSTISGNTADGSGGGIENDDGSRTIVNNSTISGNTAGRYGGGIDNFESTVNVTYTTIANNTASTGGGIYNDSSSYIDSTANVGNTIIGNNAATIAPDASGTFNSQGFNLVENPNGNTGFNQPGDLTSQDPQLGTLQDNGGPTQTQALLAGSPAIDAGDPTFTPPPATDQRGSDRVADGNGDGVPRLDIGAFERQPNGVQAINFQVETSNAATDGQLFSLFGAPADSGTLTMSFDGPPGTYNLRVDTFDEQDGQGQLALTRNGTEVASWILDQDLPGYRAQPQTARSLWVEDLALVPGDILSLEGTVHQHEFARVDSLMLIPQALAWEAEAFDVLTGYRVEAAPGASGGQVLSLLNADTNIGRAKTTFTGPSGTYDLLVGTFDERDGQGQLALEQNGTELASWTLDQDLPGYRAQPQTDRELRLEGVALSTGDELSLIGTVERDEFARVDFLKALVPASDPLGGGEIVLL